MPGYLLCPAAGQVKPKKTAFRGEVKGVAAGSKIIDIAFSSKLAGAKCNEGHQSDGG
jgi:hypothetical protein